VSNRESALHVCHLYKKIGNTGIHKTKSGITIVQLPTEQSPSLPANEHANAIACLAKALEVVGERGHTGCSGRDSGDAS
jgi:hypothetical protein